MEAENAHDFDRCIAAFSHPRYEIVATGEVWDGQSGVNGQLFQAELIAAIGRMRGYRARYEKYALPTE